MLKTNPFAKVIISPHFSPPFLIFFSKKVIFLIFNSLNTLVFHFYYGIEMLFEYRILS